MTNGLLLLGLTVRSSPAGQRPLLCAPTVPEVTTPHEYGWAEPQYDTGQAWQPRQPAQYSVEPYQPQQDMYAQQQPSQPQPVADPILNSPEYQRGYAYYVSRGAPVEVAQSEAYRWAAEQIAVRPMPGMPVINVVNQVGAYAVAPVAPTFRTEGLSSAAHLAHLIATLFTCGAWAPFWLAHVLIDAALRAHRRRQTI